MYEKYVGYEGPLIAVAPGSRYAPD